jgi:hypothetical protein
MDAPPPPAPSAGRGASDLTGPESTLTAASAPRHRREHGRTRGPEDIARCPCDVAIVPPRLAADERESLSDRRWTTLVLEGVATSDCKARVVVRYLLEAAFRSHFPGTFCRTAVTSKRPERGGNSALRRVGPSIALTAGGSADKVARRPWRRCSVLRAS